MKHWTCHSLMCNHVSVLNSEQLMCNHCICSYQWTNWIDQRGHLWVICRVNWYQCDTKRFINTWVTFWFQWWVDGTHFCSASHAFTHPLVSHPGWDMPNPTVSWRDFEASPSVKKVRVTSSCCATQWCFWISYFSRRMYIRCIYRPMRFIYIMLFVLVVRLLGIYTLMRAYQPF